jgi:aryl-alcohol dehydrogenase-like predicted oxidoreductase
MEDEMLSKKVGRRKFIKTFSSTLLGIAASNILKVRSSLGKSEKTPTLEYRTLGKTGLKITAVSMGVMNCSDPAVVHRAFDLGINFYDTAPSYMRGTNEEMVGAVLKGKREKVFIQTKVQVHEEKQMRASLEKSLRRLQTDYIDVLLWHGLRSPEEVSDAGLFEFMSNVKKEGKARFTGFSAHSHMASLLREAAKVNYHDVALVSYNFTHSKDLRDAVAMAEQSGIGIIAMKTQAGGYKKEKMGGLTPHQAALKYVLMDQNVSAAIPGVTTIEQIEECSAAMGTSFSKGDLETLKRYQSFLQGRICTMCGGCVEKCPYEVPHQDLLRLVMYHKGYENDSLAKESLRTITKYYIQRCSECPSCSIVCRRGLDIQAQVRSVQKLLI